MTTIREQLVDRADELLQAAFEGSMKVLNDPDAPATSRASATGNAIRLYELLVGDGGSEKEPSEMSADELQRSIDQLQKLQPRRQ